jgi:GT2 family glycosyltransferase
MRDVTAPPVDIIIAVRNEEQRLGACLESFLDQDYTGPVRIIVVDNGSTDSTREVCGRFPVELLVEEKPGPGAARNTGWKSGTAELVAFIDGHCVASRPWVREMVARFADRRVGAAQAEIMNSASDDHVERYLATSGTSDPDSILDDTVRGQRNIYPWVLSGNCVFTREVLEHVGGFDETLPACEDVDISWKAVLSGYLLEYAPAAEVVHWNDDAWDSFVQKAVSKGRGAAVRAHRYLPHGARKAFAPFSRADTDPDTAAIEQAYRSGYELEEQRILAGEVSNVEIPLPGVRAELRPQFDWTGDVSLSISPDSIYWLRDDAQTIVIHHPSKSRVVLDGTADFVWRRFSSGMNRDQLVNEISKRYHLPPEKAMRDCDDFVLELVQLGVLCRHER